MSIWTKVVGVIRVDCIKNELDIENTLGVMSDFYDYNENCILPEGSEGSLFYTIVRDTHHKRTDEKSKSILITGDLRDYENLNELHNWFKETCEKLNKLMYVGDVSLYAYNDLGKTLTITNKDINIEED